MANKKKGRSKADLLYPEEEISYNGLTIVVKALPARKALDLHESMIAVQNALSGAVRGGKIDLASMAPIVTSFREDVELLLDRSVEVHGIDEPIRALDLPVKVFPRLLLSFVRLNFDLGNWTALIEEMGLGDTVRALWTPMSR